MIALNTSFFFSGSKNDVSILFVTNNFCAVISHIPDTSFKFELISYYTPILSHSYLVTLFR